MNTIADFLSPLLVIFSISGVCFYALFLLMALVAIAIAQTPKERAVYLTLFFIIALLGLLNVGLLVSYLFSIPVLLGSFSMYGLFFSSLLASFPWAFVLWLRWVACGGGGGFCRCSFPRVIPSVCPL